MEGGAAYAAYPCILSIYTTAVTSNSFLSTTLRKCEVVLGMKKMNIQMVVKLPDRLSPDSSGVVVGKYLCCRRQVPGVINSYAACDGL